MHYQKVDCPHCGNEIVVKNISEGQKCHWCRRLVLAKFRKGKGNKMFCEVEPMDFPDDGSEFKKKSVNKWKDKDVYGF